MSDTAAPLRTPEEVFNGDNLPDDLKWIITHFGLSKKDPAVVLMAWHWHKTNQEQQVIDGATMRLKAILDARVAQVEHFAETMAVLHPGLDQLAKLLAQDEVSRRGTLLASLQKPIDQTVDALQKITARLNHETVRFTWQKYLAVYLAGFFTGGIFVLCALLQ